MVFYIHSTNHSGNHNNLPNDILRILLAFGQLEQYYKKLNQPIANISLTQQNYNIFNAAIIKVNNIENLNILQKQN